MGSSLGLPGIQSSNDWMLAYLKQMYPGTWIIRRSPVSYRYDFIYYNEQKTKYARYTVESMRLAAYDPPSFEGLMREVIIKIKEKMEKVSYSEKIMDILLYDL